MDSILEGGEILRKIQNYAKFSDEIRIAAPFWGEDSISLLGFDAKSSHLGSSRKLICNLESGACNPKPIKSLMNEYGWEARTNARLHAKLYLFSDAAILGSANPSANGLALEGLELFGWHELCVEVREPKRLSALSAWFEKMWRNRKETFEIDDKTLKVAGIDWKRNRRERPAITARREKRRAKRPSFIEYARSFPQNVRDRNIIITTYGGEAEQWATERFKKVRRERCLPRGYDFYQNWPKLNAGTIVIDYAYDEKGYAEYSDIWQVPEDAVIKDRRGSITLVKEIDKILGLRLSAEDKKDLKIMVLKWIEPHKKRIEEQSLVSEMEITLFLSLYGEI